MRYTQLGYTWCPTNSAEILPELGIAKSAARDDTVGMTFPLDPNAPRRKMAGDVPPPTAEPLYAYPFGVIGRVPDMPDWSPTMQLAQTVPVGRAADPRAVGS